jgi:hypothetical protein
MGASYRALIEKWYAILFMKDLPDKTLAEVLVDICDRNPQVYEMIYDELKFTRYHQDA